MSMKPIQSAILLGIMLELAGTFSVRTGTVMQSSACKSGRLLST